MLPRAVGMSLHAGGGSWVVEVSAESFAVILHTPQALCFSPGLEPMDARMGAPHKIRERRDGAKLSPRHRGE